MASYTVTTNAQREITLSRFASNAGGTNTQAAQGILNKELDQERERQRQQDIATYGQAMELATQAGRNSMVATVAKPTIQPIPNQSAIVNIDIAIQVIAADPIDNVPLIYSATGLPVGVSISSSDGMINGRATIPGTFPIVVRATKVDKLVYIETNFTLTITP